MSDSYALSIAELCQLIGAEPPAEHASRVITNIATLESAQESDVTFLLKESFLEEARVSKAGLFIVPPGISTELSPVVAVPNVMAAVVKLINHYHPEHLPDPGAHRFAAISGTAHLAAGVSIGPGAVIEDEVQIGERTIIGAGCFIGRGTTIGQDCRLMPHVSLMDRCRIGNRVRLHSGVVLGADGFRYEPINGRVTKIPQVGIVVIEDDVEIGANSTIDRAFLTETRVGARTKIDNLVHVGHNVIIGSDCIIVAQVGIAGSVRIGRGVVIGGKTGIKDHVTIGDGAQIGGNSAVQHDVAPRARMLGSPAVPARTYVSFVRFYRNFPGHWARLRTLINAPDDESE